MGESVRVGEHVWDKGMFIMQECTVMEVCKDGLNEWGLLDHVSDWRGTLTGF